MLMAMILAAEVILIMRVWALWDRAIWVPCLFIALLSAEVGISVWAIGRLVFVIFGFEGAATDTFVSVGSKPLQIPPQLQMTPCILGGTPSNAERLWLYWLCPVVTDSVIVFLVLL